jgi:hypothetical protein
MLHCWQRSRVTDFLSTVNGNTPPRSVLDLDTSEIPQTFPFSDRKLSWPQFFREESRHEITSLLEEMLPQRLAGSKTIHATPQSPSVRRSPTNSVCMTWPEMFTSIASMERCRSEMFEAVAGAVKCNRCARRTKTAPGASHPP